MSKKSCFRTLFGSQRVHEFQTLVKEARHDFYPIAPGNLDKLSRKKSAIVRSEMLGLFF